jgi:hypothetical protein
LQGYRQLLLALLQRGEGGVALGRGLGELSGVFGFGGGERLLEGVARGGYIAARLGQLLLGEFSTLRLLGRLG